jgi:hypothetical protein
VTLEVSRPHGPPQGHSIGQAMELLNPTRPGSKQLLHVGHSGFVLRTPWVPRDLLAQVDYDWLVVDTNSSADSLGAGSTCLIGK